jgi:outer membrane protein assembly factor BamE (lipoprotein component of BamABCDE complex)
MNTFLWSLLSPRQPLSVLALSGALLASGCMTVGHPFPSGQVSSIRIGETSQNDIYTTFGSPWRTGIDNSFKTWTYGDYSYSMFSESSSEDLVIKFDKRGMVSSFTYNTSKRSK